jgi:hypothetical protein
MTTEAPGEQTGCIKGNFQHAYDSNISAFSFKTGLIGVMNYKREIILKGT